MNGGEVESCSIIKRRNKRLTVGEDDMRNTWKEYFADLYNVDMEKKILDNVWF